MDLVVRPARLDDVPALGETFIDSVRGLAPRAYEPDQVLAWVSASLDQRSWPERIAKGIAFVAERDDRILGWIEVEGGMHLDMFYCRTEAAGTGVAAALYGTLEMYQRSNGVMLMQTEASLLLRPFLERRGWRVDAEEIVARLGTTITRYRMSKRLLDESGSYVRSICERCFRSFSGGRVRYACAHNCSFCESCAREMGLRCPNCGGSLDAAV